jgi:hypothetical protein
MGPVASGNRDGMLMRSDVGVVADLGGSRVGLLAAMI